ncbi:PIN domain-containing protein [Geodermatophilus sp. URMC 63]
MIVFDASALLALLHREAGWDVVARAAAMDSVAVSAVNYAEVMQKAAQHAIAAEDVDAALEGLGVVVSPFGRLDARLAASFYRHRSGLGLGDRVCLALAHSLSAPALTGDRDGERWADELGVDLRIIR